MGSPPAVCRNCGARFAATAFQVENSTDVTFSGCATICPYCGGTADIVDGTYDFVGEIIAAFRAPGVTRQNVEAFRDVVEAVNAGRATPEQAVAQVAELGSAFAGVWKWVNANSGGLGVLLAIMSLYLAYISMKGSDETAEKLQASIEKQTQVVQMIEAELRKQNVAVPQPVASAAPTPQWQLQVPQQRPARATYPNRHERRKTKAKMRRR